MNHLLDELILMAWNFLLDCLPCKTSETDEAVRSQLDKKRETWIRKYLKSNRHQASFFICLPGWIMFSSISCGPAIGFGPYRGPIISDFNFVDFFSILLVACLALPRKILSQTSLSCFIPIAALPGRVIQASRFMSCCVWPSLIITFSLLIVLAENVFSFSHRKRLHDSGPSEPLSGPSTSQTRFPSREIRYFVRHKSN